MVLHASLFVLVVMAASNGTALAADGARQPLRTEPVAASAATAPSLVSEDDIDAVWPKLQPEQQFTVIEQLLHGARFDTAERLLERQTVSTPAQRDSRTFYLALVRKGQGRTDEAISMLRQLLVDHPEYARVRLELAHALYAAQDDDAARHNFELVLGGAGSSPAIAETVRSYIAAIDSRKRWDLTAFLSIAPSTNLNQGAETANIVMRDQFGNPLDFTLDKANRKQSGIGLVGGLQGSYRHPLADSLDLVLAGGGTFKRYRDGDFNTAAINASLGPRVRFEWGYLGLYGLIDKSWYSDEDQVWSWGGLLSGNVRFGPQDVVFGDLTCQRRYYDTNWRGTDLSYQDGHLCTASGRYEHYFSNALFARALFTLGRERTGRAHLDDDFWSAGAGIYTDLPLGLSVYLQALYTDRDFDGIYPTSAEARHDKRWDLSASFSKRDWNWHGYTPLLQYTYTTNASNIGIFTYDAHSVSLTATRKF